VSATPPDLPDASLAVPPGLASLAGGAGRRRRPVRVTEEIIESLRADIALGRLVTGARLPTERDLAKHFGVSQPTIRESVRVLEAMGLVEVRHGSGAYVTGATHAFVAKSLQTMLQLERVGILDVLEVRDVLARFSATRAVTHGTDEELEQIEELSAALDESPASTDPHEFVEVVLRFLAAVSAAAHSPLLFVLETVLNRLVISLEVLAYERAPELSAQWVRDLSGERHAFVAALKSRDVEAAVESRTIYLSRLRERIAAVPELANLRLSDEDATRVLATVGLGI
jgi:GntR family transcriptional regulator, transcriptional repressor for pyruvate dehydrogenase complex